VPPVTLAVKAPSDFGKMGSICRRRRLQNATHGVFLRHAVDSTDKTGLAATEIVRKKCPISRRRVNHEAGFWNYKTPRQACGLIF
jgi:hypothetical protein